MRAIGGVMITVTLDIDNNAAHSCSPIEYIRKYILQDATLATYVNTDTVIYKTPHANIVAREIEQI
jgi:hypothetical protein